ncbi:HTH-type transcriptional regulator ImmR (fragment) [uncultured Sporomusa sp.]|uniref:HTH-type transcriptional regulator ImmR n=1 Tax=uncultured Sporomusa sp. TaxID=307249 RepID=A0A212M1W7_9FIRM
MKLTKMKFARLQAGFTQVEAAEKLGIVQSYLSMIETNQANVSNELLIKMSKLYDCPPTDLK